MSNSNIHIQNINSLIIKEIQRNDTSSVKIMELNSLPVNRLLNTPSHFDGNITILVLSGHSRISINFQEYELNANTVILLSPSHIFQFIESSDDFRCLWMVVEKSFMNEMDPTEIIYVRTKYGVSLFNQPVVQLTENETKRLTSHTDAINNAIANNAHYYYKSMVFYTIMPFFLDLSDIIEKKNLVDNHEKMSRCQSITKTFIELLTTNYQQEHSVDFYAEAMHLTPHHLTLTVKKTTGQTVCGFIYEMLYSEARSMLTQSKLSVQEIASSLNFSDQSAFGKFFKRKSGISPLEYRKRS